VLLTLAALAALFGVALWPATLEVDVATAKSGPLRVTVDEEGETRIRHRFVVSTPVAGRVLRVDLEPGDRVTRGNTVVALVQPEPAPLLDARSRAEAEAAVAAARAALGRARAELSRSTTTRDLARSELKRTRELAAAGLTTEQTLDARQSEAQSAGEQVQAATFLVASAAADLERAQARLRPAGTSTAAVVTIEAPVDGVILKRFRESEAVVPAGEQLVEIGDPRNLELVSDLLSTDAVRVPRGARVLIVEWGGDHEIEARVRRVEPSGFTKISALGVEEQRVNVVMDFVDPADAWSRLGDAYRVEVRIVVWEGERVLKVPTSALFRHGDEWAVYVVDDGRARRTILQLGHRNDQEAEVTSGLSDAAVVIVHPSDALADGARVEPRGGAGR
jgi:HlyD family secretion protein